MDKLPLADYRNMIQRVDRTMCGAVYPLSIAEGIQPGDIYASQDSALFWHYSGFAFPCGACPDSFLDCVYETFLSVHSATQRRFILFATNEKVKRFFSRKESLASGKRYFFEYPNDFSPQIGTLPANLTVREIDAELFDKTKGAVTPRFSWADSSEFLRKGKGHCVTDGKAALSWAFSAAVSADEIDIGVETRPDFRRLGLGAIVAERMIRYCLEQRKRPVWACDADNIASRKLAEKLGFVKTSECDVFKKA